MKSGFIKLKNNIKKTTILLTVIFSILTASGWTQEKTTCMSGAGFEIERIGNNIVVTGIYKNSPADGKISVGDNISTINGKSAASMPSEECFSILDQPPGAVISIQAQRGESDISTDITTAFFAITPETVPGHTIPPHRILGFDSGNIFSVEFTEKPDYKKDDQFYLFKDSKLLSIIRIKEISGTRAYFLANGKFTDRQRSKTGMQLFYRGYRPIEYQPTTDWAKEKNDSEIRVRVSNYDIFISENDHIRILVEITNNGKVPAKAVYVKCRMTGQMDHQYFSETKTAKWLQPGDKEYFEFFTLIPLPDGCHVGRVGKTLNIERNDALRSLVERMDCKFEVDAF
ncbi:MAG: PDZ domain-containing protein [Firmicutes bacterium]|nr:PDZ domain-containing protein [Bacillota bacterium]